MSKNNEYKTENKVKNVIKIASIMVTVASLIGEITTLIKNRK